MVGRLRCSLFVGSEFPGDQNEVLKNVQFRVYGEMLTRLFSRARDRYLDACGVVDVETDLAVRLKEMNYFDHRTLQDAHDLIAAWFRFSGDTSGQLRLEETPEAYELRLATDWHDFFGREIGRLIESDEFTRNILTAAVFANTDRGYAAEASTRAYLKQRYLDMLRAKPT